MGLNTTQLDRAVDHVHCVQNGTTIHLKPIWWLGQSFGRSWMAKMGRRLTVMAWSHQGVNQMLREARRMMISKVIIEWLGTFHPHKQCCSNHMLSMLQFFFNHPLIFHSHSQYTTLHTHTFTVL